MKTPVLEDIIEFSDEESPEIIEKIAEAIKISQNKLEILQLKKSILFSEIYDAQAVLGLMADKFIKNNIQTAAARTHLAFFTTQITSKIAPINLQQNFLDDAKFAELITSFQEINLRYYSFLKDSDLKELKKNDSAQESAKKEIMEIYDQKIGELDDKISFINKIKFAEEQLPSNEPQLPAAKIKPKDFYRCNFRAINHELS